MSEQGNILIVDDSEGIRESLRRDLARLGYRCATAADGREGLEKTREDDFDVALVDLKMPGMDGLGLLEAIEQAGLDTVPIVLSGHAQISEAVEATKHGAFDFIEKPAAMETIRGTIARAIRHRRALRRARVMAGLAGQWKVAFDSAADMIVLLRPDGCIRHVNRAMARRVGRRADDLIGKPCHEALCQDDHPAEDCPFGRDLRRGHGSPVEFRQQAWGGYFEITSAPLGEQAETARGSVHILRDITDSKLAEDQLRNARAHAELLIESISSILICLDEDAVVRQWNATAEETFGIEAGDAVGTALSASGVQWDFEPIGAALTQCMADGVPVRLDDIHFVRPDGRNGFLAITINPLKGVDDRSLGVLILGRDITERKILESQLAHAQKLEGIGQLAAGIAHEINTPMQYVGDNVRFLEDCFADLLGLLRVHGRFLQQASRGPVSGELLAETAGAVEQADVEYLVEEIPRAIQQSLEGVSRITKIVRAMRDFSHPGVEAKTAVDINKAIDNTITICRNEWKYVSEMQTDYDADLPPVPCLPGEINQVLLNLIINAAHAIGEVVGDGSEGKGTITVSTRRDGEWAEIRVRDTGCGIPEAARDRVFQPFFTTKEVGKGTGQGLAIAHSVIVNKHGGTIAFETEVGKGTTFIIRLPVLQETPEEELPAEDLSHAEETASPVC